MQRLVVLAFVSACLGLAAPSAAAEPRPNIILFLVDDMGWMDCGAYGSKYYETPNMDRLASQGMRFTDAYSCPLCSPTRATLLTGQYSARHGITSASGHQPPQPPGHAFLPDKAAANRAFRYPESKNYLELSQYTLAEALRDAGYRTGHFGKWHLGLTKPYWPEAQGFDVAFHCHPDPGPPGGYFSPYGVVADGEPRGQRKVGTITDGPKGEYITDRLTDEAVRFIEASKDRPFYLNLWHYGVHGPWGHKEAYTAEFARKTDPRGQQGNPIMASMLKSVDEGLGRVLDTLDRLKLSDRTILLFVSDNGGNTHSFTEADNRAAKRDENSPQLKEWRKWAGKRPPTNNAPLRDGKGRLYEGGIRVPLMVRWPGRIAAGSTSAAVVGAIDVYPTLLDLAGLSPVPAQKLDGVSIAPVLKQTGTLNREAYFTWFPHLVPGVVVRKGDWKLIRRFEKRPEYEGLHELFNLKDDLGETTNLAAKMPDKVKELDALIDAFVKDTGALYPQPNPDHKTTTAPPAKPDASTSADRMEGLVPRFCKAVLTGGVLRIEADGRTPFLGTGQVKAAGPLTLELRARSTTGGTGKVQWKTAEQVEFPKDGQAVEFKLSGGKEWETVTIAVPIEGKPGIVRLYLPAERAPVEIASITYRSARTKQPVRTWAFGESK